MMYSLKHRSIPRFKRSAPTLAFMCLLALQAIATTVSAHSVGINPEHQLVWAVAFSPDDQYVIATTQEGFLIVSNKESCIARELVVPSPVSDYRWGHSLTAIAWSPRSSEFATAMRDGTVRLWNIVPLHMGEPYITEKALFVTNRPFADRQPGLRTVAFSPDGSLIAAAGHGPEIYVWSIERGTAPLQVLNGQAETINFVAFGLDNSTLLSAADDGAIRYWDLKQGIEVRTIKAPDMLVNAAVSRDRRYLATASLSMKGEGARTRVFDLQSGEEVRRLSGGPWSVAFAPNNRVLATGDSDEGHIRLFDIEQGREVWRVVRQDRPIRSLAFSRDGKYLLAGVELDAPYLLDAATGAILKRYGWGSCSVR